MNAFRTCEDNTVTQDLVAIKEHRLGSGRPYIDSGRYYQWQPQAKVHFMRII